MPDGICAGRERYYRQDRPDTMQTDEKNILIGVLAAGSRDALASLRQLTSTLDALRVEYQIEVVSVWHNPGQIRSCLKDWAARNAEVIIAAEEPSQGLAGFVAAHTNLPVIALPLGGEIAQAHWAFPVALVGVNCVRQAVYLAVRILALQHPRYAGILNTVQEAGEIELAQLSSELRDGVGIAGAKPAAPAKPGKPPVKPHKPVDEELPKELTPRLRTKSELAGVRSRRAGPGYSPLFKELFRSAHAIAQAYRHEQILPEHFLAAMIDSPACSAHMAIKLAQVDFEKLATAVAALFPKPARRALGAFALSPDSSELLQRTRTSAAKSGHTLMTTADLLQAVADHEQLPASAALREIGLSCETLLRVIREMPEVGGDMRPVPYSGKESNGEGSPEIRQEDVRRIREQLARTKTATSPPAQSVQQATESLPVPDNPPVAEPASAELAQEPDGERKTRIVVCDPFQPSLEAVEQIADALLEGGVVAFPTDTVYGLGVDATNTRAIERLYAMKNRPADKALPVLIHSVALLKHIVSDIPADVNDLMERFWPGPLTIIFPKHPGRFQSVSPTATLGVRIPDHYLALGILSMIGRPVATTSANISGQTECVNAQQVSDLLTGKADLIVDGGESPGKVISTVLSVAEEPYRILRHGAIPQKAIEDVLGHPIQG